MRRGGMEWTKCRLGGFKVSRGNIEDKPASLRELCLVAGQADFAKPRSGAGDDTPQRDNASALQGERCLVRPEPVSRNAICRLLWSNRHDHGQCGWSPWNPFLGATSSGRNGTGYSRDWRS